MTEKLIKELNETAAKKRISCKALRSMAERFGIPYKEAGEAADALGIKITDCELGCF